MLKVDGAYVPSSFAESSRKSGLSRYILDAIAGAAARLRSDLCAACALVIDAPRPENPFRAGTRLSNCDHDLTGASTGSAVV